MAEKAIRRRKGALLKLFEIYPIRTYSHKTYQMPHKSMLMNPPGLPSHGRREGKGKRGRANIHWDPGKICKADTFCWRALIYLAFSEIIILTCFAQELQCFEDWLAKLVLTGHTSCSPKPHRSVLVAVPTPPWDTFYPGVLFPSSTSQGGMSPPGIPACFPFLLLSQPEWSNWGWFQDQWLWWLFTLCSVGCFWERSGVGAGLDMGWPFPSSNYPFQRQ